MSRRLAGTRGAWIGLALCCGLHTLPAAAAEGKEGSPPEVFFFLALAILVIAGRAAGEVFQRLRQPAVLGQLMTGVILGPTVLGRLWPDFQHQLFAPNTPQMTMLNAIAQLGILLLLLFTGMETDLPLLRKIGRPAVTVSLAGIVIPFACGVALGQLLPADMLPDPAQRLVASLFLGVALSISSVKIVASIVREMNFMRRNVGQIIVATAIIDDTVGWLIIALVLSLAQDGTIALAAVAKHTAEAAAFLVLSFTLGRRIVFFLIRWANDHFVSETPVISVIIGLMLVSALITSSIGLHTLLGAFVCGILVGESPILTRRIEGQLRGIIASLFMPVFFAVAGLSADLGALRDPRFLSLTAALVVLASLGKGIGAFAGGAMAGLDSRECLALALGMNGRGSTEVVVATIGLSLGILSPDLFTAIVSMAIVTTLAMPVTLRWALARLELKPDEQKRLEREAFEERGFVANIERLLVAVDESGNGQFASRLAGSLAGFRGTSTTVLQLGQKQARRDGAPEKTTAAVEAAAADSAQQTEAGTREIQLTHRRSDQDPKAAVSEEADRGYDLLFVGLEDPVNADGTFRPRVARAASGFDGALAILVGHGEHLERPSRAPLNIIVPVDSSEITSRAAEVAFGIARGANASVTVVHVGAARTGSTSVRSRPVTELLRSHIYQEIALKRVCQIADHFGVQVRTVVSPNPNLPQSIARLAGREPALAVIGVHRSTGDVLDFGAIARELAIQPNVSVLFVAS